jgi:Gram-negative bacterial TonB protein C-terminal
MTARGLVPLLAASAQVLGIVPGADAASTLDPAGMWACVAYSGPTGRNERFLLDLRASGEASYARQSDTSAGQWLVTSGWTARRDELTFSVAASEREYRADLRRSTLGGQWTSPAAFGGWWCARRLDAAESAARPVRRSAAEFYVPPLVPEISASPRYPREAVREAREGRAVACFLVDPNGEIRDPELIELSDEIFRDTTMLALYRSSFRSSPNAAVPRAGCRSYTFELDAQF